MGRIVQLGVRQIDDRHTLPDLIVGVAETGGAYFDKEVVVSDFSY